MGMTRAEQIALGGAALLAMAMPLAMLRGTAATTDDAAPALLTLPPTPPALARVYTRALFGGGAAVDIEEAALPDDAPALAGIVGRIGSDAVAMVRGADGATRTLDIGEGIDGWTLESLAIDAAYFTRGGQRVRVPLPAG